MIDEECVDVFYYWYDLVVVVLMVVGVAFGGEDE